MAYTVHIRNESTGEVRAWAADLEWNDSSLFWWTEGNMGCDCNRETFWHEAGGEATSVLLDDTECGDERFKVVRIELADGTVFDDEHELNPMHFERT